MAELDSVVEVTITSTANPISQTGFGVPLIAGYHTKYLDRVRSYRTLSALVADGFATTSAIYKAASRIKGQNPSPALFKVGRRANAFTKSYDVGVTDATEGLVLTWAIGAEGLTTVTQTYTVLAAATPSSVATAIAALIDPLAVVTASAAGAVVTIAAPAGVEISIAARSPSLTLKDNTADPGITADLTAIAVADGDFYGLVIDSNSEAEVNAAATWALAEKKLFGTNSADTDIGTSSTTDLFSDLQALGQDHTFALFTPSDTLSYAGAAWLAKGLVAEPGTINWKFKTLAGVSADKLTETQVAYVEGKSGNTYTVLGGRNITGQGVVSSGTFIDIVHLIDYLTARVQESVYFQLVNSPKVPQTNAGIDVIRLAVRAPLLLAQGNGALNPEEEIVVTAPTMADIPAADKAARLLPDIEFSAYLGGAWNKVQIIGTLSI